MKCEVAAHCDGYIDCYTKIVIKVKDIRKAMHSEGQIDIFTNESNDD